MAGRAFGAGEAAGRVERDEIDVRIDARQQLRETMRGFRRIVFPGNERPLEEDPFAGEGAVLAARVDEHRERPAFAGGDECGAFLLGRTVEADGEAVGLRFGGEAQNGRHDADGADGDFRWTDANAADVRDAGERG